MLKYHLVKILQNLTILFWEREIQATALTLKLLLKKTNKQKTAVDVLSSLYGLPQTVLIATCLELGQKRQAF